MKMYSLFTIFNKLQIAKPIIFVLTNLKVLSKSNIRWSYTHKNKRQFIKRLLNYICLLLFWTDHIKCEKYTYIFYFKFNYTQKKKVIFIRTCWRDCLWRSRGRFGLVRRNWIVVLVRVVVDVGIRSSDAEAEPGRGICDRPPLARPLHWQQPVTNLKLGLPY